MSKVGFNKLLTEANALTASASNTSTIYVTTDTHRIVMGGNVLGTEPLKVNISSSGGTLSASELSRINTKGYHNVWLSIDNSEPMLVTQIFDGSSITLRCMSIGGTSIVRYAVAINRSTGVYSVTQS